jgi:glycerol dehydrogenase
MHGSVVAFGTITQLLLEDAPKEEIKNVMDFCHSVGLPVTLKELGVTDVSRVRIAAEKACIPGETIHNMAGDVTPEQLYDALLAADLLGQEYFR